MARPDLATAVARRLAREAAKPRPESPIAVGLREAYAQLDARVALVREQPHLLDTMPAHERTAVLTRAETLDNRAAKGTRR